LSKINASEDRYLIHFDADVIFEIHKAIG